MQKEKRNQSKDEENDSSSRKRRKAGLSKPVSFVSTGKADTRVYICIYMYIYRISSSYIYIGTADSI